MLYEDQVIPYLRLPGSGCLAGVQNSQTCSGHAAGLGMARESLLFAARSLAPALLLVIIPLFHRVLLCKLHETRGVESQKHSIAHLYATRLSPPLPKTRELHTVPEGPLLTFHDSSPQTESYFSSLDYSFSTCKLYI